MRRGKVFSFAFGDVTGSCALESFSLSTVATRKQAKFGNQHWSFQRSISGVPGGGGYELLWDDQATEEGGKGASAIDNGRGRGLEK